MVAGLRGRGGKPDVEEVRVCFGPCEKEEKKRKKMQRRKRCGL
jgi:hypothetical protein